MLRAEITLLNDVFIFSTKGAQIFQEYSSHLKILDAIWVT
jgi:hypothetical protein